MALSKILVVIDPTKDEQPAFERGLDSARLTGAQLHLYTCVNSDYGFPDHEAAKAGLSPKLESLAERAFDDGQVDSFFSTFSLELGSGTDDPVADTRNGETPEGESGDASGNGPPFDPYAKGKGGSKGKKKGHRSATEPE